MRRSRARWLVLAAVVLAVVFAAAAAGAETTPFFARLITPTDSDQWQPSVWGSNVAFRDTRNGNDDVYLYSLASNAESRITTLTTDQRSPDLSEDHLVYEDWSTPTAPQIRSLNLITGVHSAVTTDGAYYERPKTDGHMAVYTRRSALGEPGDVYAFDLKMGEGSIIASGTADQRDPVISGERVAWLDERNGSTDVYVYNMETMTESRITTDGAEPTGVALWGDTLVYSDVRGASEDLYAHDLATGADRLIANSDNDETTPDIWGSRVVFVEDVGGSDNIVVFDLRTNARVTLVDDTGDANEPSIYRNRVAYTYLGSTFDVYVGTILVPRVTCVVAPFASYGTTTTVTGTLESVGGVALQGQGVIIESSTDGMNWTQIGTATTDVNGNFTFTSPAITAKTWLRAVYAPPGELSSESAVVAVSPRFATALSIRASTRTPGYHKWPTISGALTNTSLNNVGVVGKRVYLEGSSNGKTFTVSASTITTAGGAYSFTGKPTNKRWYRVVFRGDDEYAASQSSTLTVTPKVSLTRPSTAASVRRNSAHRVTGYLKPRHTSGTKPVRIQCYRRQSGRWVLRKTYSATVTNYKTYSRYRATIRLSPTGSWRIRAYAPADSLHSATYSSYRNIRVR